MKKSGKLVCHVANSNIDIDSSPTLQRSVGIIALFEKIYGGEPILTVISNVGEDVCTDSFENLSENSLKEHNRIIPNSTHLFSHWSIPLKGQ
jgi:hypothetical protein